MKAPCYQCPDRHVLCHSECEKYIAFRAERDRMNADRRIENTVNESRFARMAKAKAKYEKKRMMT